MVYVLIKLIGVFRHAVVEETVKLACGFCMTVIQADALPEHISTESDSDTLPVVPAEGQNTSIESP